MDQKQIDKILKIKGWLSIDEGYLLYYLALRLGAKGAVVEIGSFQGKSTIFLAAALKEIGDGVVYAVDPHLGILEKDKRGTVSTWKKFRENIKTFNLDAHISAKRQTSVDANKNWHEPIAVLNIDALHDYESVKTDLHCWLPHLMEGGVVVCHDGFGPSYPGVFRAIKETVFTSPDYKYIGANGSQIFAVKGSPDSLWDKLNLARSKFILNFTIKLWQEKKILSRLREVICYFFLKPFYLNQFTFRATLRRYLRLPIAPVPPSK